jgi:hypothetical protein
VDRHEWDTFLGRFQLRVDIYGQGGCVNFDQWNNKTYRNWENNGGEDWSYNNKSKVYEDVCAESGYSCSRWNSTFEYCNQ